MHYQYISHLRLKRISLIIHYFSRIVGDNIDFEIHARMQSKDHSNQSIHWTHQYAGKDRVIDRMLETRHHQKAVCDIQLAELLPDENTCARLQKRWAVLVSRVVTSYLKEFKFLQREVVRHIPHQYSHQMSQKSDIVSIIKNNSSKLVF